MTHEAGNERVLQDPSFDTLRWGGDRLDMLDQRLLPTHVEYRSYDSAAGVTVRIRCEAS
jgi:methylthioribose-1-phosphate isomerase